MPKINLLEARGGINPLLTGIALGYRNESLIYPQLFPVVPDIKLRGGTLITFGKEQFIQHAGIKRAPGADIATMNVGISQRTYTTEQYAIQGKLPNEIREEAIKSVGLDLGTIYVNAAMDALLLMTEVVAAQVASDPNNYSAQNKLALTGAAKWSHNDSNPVIAIQAACEAIRTNAVVYPNLMVISQPIFNRLVTHPYLLSRISGVKDTLAIEDLQRILQIERIVVGKAKSTSDPKVGLSDIWGNVAILAYVPKVLTPLSAAARYTPSFGYTYQLAGTPYAKTPYDDPTCMSIMFPCFTEFAINITSPEAGYLFTDVL